MGGCVSQQRKGSNSVNTRMDEILKEYSIQEMKNLWDPEQLKLIDSRLIFKKVTKEDFIKLFPKLPQHFSKKTVSNIYAMFKNKQTDSLTKAQLIDRLTLVQKVEDIQVMGELLYYTYAVETNKIYQKGVDPQMTKENLKLFLDQNKPFIQSQNEQEIIKEKTKKSKSIQKQEFLGFFGFYNLKKYKQLFDLNVEGLQAQLIAEIFNKAPIKNKKNDDVSVISIQWFRKWQDYLKIVYGVDIFYEENNLQIKKIQIRNEPSKQVKKQKRPGPINNEPLKNSQNLGLRRDITQFLNYYALPAWIFVKLRSIYGGGPIYKRKYPEIHSYFVVRVEVDGDAKFIPNAVDYYSDEDRTLQIKHFFGKDSHKVNISSYVCYYRYPGKTDWGVIEDITNPMSRILTHYRLYLCFLRKQLRNDFQGLYNISQKHGKKYIKRRVKNYGSLVNIVEGGKMVQGEVIGMIQGNQVIISLQNQDGNIVSHKRSVESVEKNNPNTFQEQKAYNPIAGLNNQGNSCYINSVVQCIIRTPYFGKYMGKIDFKNSGTDKMLLHKTIYDVYQRAIASNNTIDTKELKDAIDHHFPYLKGQSQEDAQQFLNSVLNKISEQLKESKKEFLLGSKMINSQELVGNLQNESNGNGGEGSVNKKIMKFFSGSNEISTVCQKCGNKNSRQEPFFTYSISLPEHRQRQLFCSLIRPGEKKAKKYGFTIDKKTKVGEVVKDISHRTKISEERLLLTSVFNGQWIQTFDGELMYREIIPYIHSNFNFICYEVRYLNEIGYKDLLKRNIQNKSIKLEVRQRQFQRKSGKYQPILIPFLAEITIERTWASVELDIDEKIFSIIQEPTGKQSGFFDNQDDRNLESNGKYVPELSATKQFDSKTIIDQKSTTSLIKQKSNMYGTKTIKSNSIVDRKNGSLPVQGKFSRKMKPYKIRFISRHADQEGTCLFCKKRFKQKQSQTKGLKKNSAVSKKLAFCDEDAEKCQFSPQQPLIEQLQFRNRIDIMLIVIDWDEDFIVRHLDYDFDDSYSEASKRLENRKDALEDILKNNLQTKQQLELRCEKNQCTGNYCERIERIHTIPNIFIIHLKRFRYDDGKMEKLMNNVVYKQELKVQNNSYELYGVVVHLGHSGAGGHYDSITKVDNKWYRSSDNKVKQITKGQLVDPNAYLLFYKKTDFEPSLMCLRF